MLRLVSILGFSAFAALAIAEPMPQPKTAEIQQLIEKLGSEDFSEREDATSKLEQIGAPAIDALRKACTAENPETVRRAREVLRKVEQKLANEKTLTPTLVELDERDTPLDSVLAVLSKQGACDVVLGGLKPEELAKLKVTVSTSGKVPFWNAVLKVCEAADLQVAVVGGFMAPGATPYMKSSRANVRFARVLNKAIVLEARDPKTPRRPAAVYGAVLVESLPFPKNTSFGASSTALLQAWPEPRLQWETTTTVKVAKATDAKGTRLATEYLPPKSSDPQPGSKEGITLIRNANGTVTIVRDLSPGIQPAGLFTPNTHQAVVQFKHADKPSEMVNQLDLSFYATVQTGIEPISRAWGLLENQNSTGVGGTDVEMTARHEKDSNGTLVANVTLSYNSKSVHPVGVFDELPGVKGTANLGSGNHTVHGILVTDKDGKPFGLGLRSGSNQLDQNGRRITVKMTLELVHDQNANNPPAAITLWGTHARQVEIPITLKDVPLTVGK